MEYFCVKNRKGLFEIGWFGSPDYVRELISTHKAKQKVLKEIRPLTQEDLENEKHRR